VSVLGGERLALVVDDDADLRGFLARVLGQQGFEVVEAADAAQTLAVLETRSPDLVTLDLTLPDLDGVELCRRIRERTDAYVLMLTGRSDEVDKLLGLETGADDYLTKPFSPRELTARVAALMRRPRTLAADVAAPAEADRTIAHAGLAVDPHRRSVSVDGQEVDLTRTEFDLLHALVTGPDRVWSRTDLITRVWGSDWAADGRAVEVHIGNLRRKLAGHSDRAYVETVRGVGYRLGS
jgi:DNA-binding response OmpR family regulator